MYAEHPTMHRTNGDCESIVTVGAVFTMFMRFPMRYRRSFSMFGG